MWFASQPRKLDLSKISGYRLNHVLSPFGFYGNDDLIANFGDFIAKCGHFKELLIHCPMKSDTLTYVSWICVKGLSLVTTLTRYRIA